MIITVDSHFSRVSLFDDEISFLFGENLICFLKNLESPLVLVFPKGKQNKKENLM